MLILGLGQKKARLHLGVCEFGPKPSPRTQPNHQTAPGSANANVQPLASWSIRVRNAVRRDVPTVRQQRSRCDRLGGRQNTLRHDVADGYGTKKKIFVTPGGSFKAYSGLRQKPECGVSVCSPLLQKPYYNRRPKEILTTHFFSHREPLDLRHCQASTTWDRVPCFVPVAIDRTCPRTDVPTSMMKLPLLECHYSSKSLHRYRFM